MVPGNRRQILISYFLLSEFRNVPHTWRVSDFESDRGQRAGDLVALVLLHLFSYRCFSTGVLLPLVLLHPTGSRHNGRAAGVRGGTGAQPAKDVTQLVATAMVEESVSSSRSPTCIEECPTKEMKYRQIRQG